MDMNVSLLKSAQVKSNVGKIDVSQFEDIKSANNTNIFSAQETIKTAENNVNMSELKAVESMMNDNCVRQMPREKGKIRTLEINPNYREEDPRTNTEKAEDDYEKAKKEYEEAKEKLEIYEAHDKYIEEEMAKYYEAHPDCKPTERKYINEEGKEVTELVESDAAKEYREGIEATYKAEHPEYVEQLNKDKTEEIKLELLKSKDNKINLPPEKKHDIEWQIAQEEYFKEHPEAREAWEREKERNPLDIVVLEYDESLMEFNRFRRNWENQYREDNPEYQEFLDEQARKKAEEFRRMTEM